MGKAAVAAPPQTAPPVFHETNGRRIALRRRAGAAPGVVWLGGFKSDMLSTKASRLDAWAAAAGRAFLRFDYSGHGESSGDFADGTIGQWLAESLDVIRAHTSGPQILVGSSMGGWIALLVARELARARQTSVRIWAEHSPFDLKDALKARGYKWSGGSDGSPRSWYVDVAEDRHPAEIEFLRTEIYQREVGVRSQTLTALERFSARL